MTLNITSHLSNELHRDRDQRFLLKNGMRVLVRESHASKAAALQVWVHAGALHERADQRGLAHVLEHMLFKSTEKHQVGELSAKVEGWGGDFNAYTSMERTVYYLSVASRFWEDALALLEDALFHPLIEKQELAKELEVIGEEIKRSHDEPAARMGQRLFKELFAGTEAGRPVIGFEDQVLRYTRDQVLEFYKAWYQPAHMTLVVTGDVDAERVFEQAEALFGGHENKAYPPPYPPGFIDKAHPIQEHRLVLMPEHFDQWRCSIAIQAPPKNHPDSLYFHIAAYILSSGATGRLQMKLKDQLGWVAAVSSSYFSLPQGGVFDVTTLPDKEHLVGVIEVALEQWLALMDHDISWDEIKRAQITFRTDRLHRNESVEGLAQSLGSQVGIYLPFQVGSSFSEYHEDYLEQCLQNLTPKTIKRVLKRWLSGRPPLYISILAPESELKLDSAWTDHLKAEIEHKVNSCWGGDLSFKHLTNDDPCKERPNPKKNTSKGVSSKKTAEKAPQVFRRTFGSQGQHRFVYRQRKGAQLFDFSCASLGGLLREKDSENGLFHLMSQIVGTGSQAESFEVFADKVEGLGAQLGAFSGKDSFGLSCHGLWETFDSLMGLWSRAFFEPAFGEQKWNAVVMETLESIRLAQDTPSHRAMLLVQEKLFDGHPYGRSVLGTKASVQNFQRQNILERFEAFRDQSPWVISCVGPVAPEQAFEKLMPYLKGMENTGTDSSDLDMNLLKSAAKPSLSGSHSLFMEREQTHGIVALPGANWVSTDRPFLDIYSQVLGGSGGRLFCDLRDQQSLAYSVSPLLSFGTQGGLIGAYIACEPSKWERAKRSLMDHVLLKAQPILEKEWERAQNYLVGSHDLDYQQGDTQVSSMGLMELYGLGGDDFLTYPEKVRTCQREEALERLNAYLNEDSFIVVSVGPQQPSPEGMD